MTAFEQLYRRNWRYVRAALIGQRVPAVDLDDLGHEVFVVALRKLPETRLDQDTERFWLRQICRYVVAGHRSRGIRRSAAVPVSDNDVPDPSDPDSLLRELESSDLMHEALERLGPAERELLALHIAGGLSFRTLGEICDCDPKTARKTFLTALRRVRAFVERGPGRSGPIGAPNAPVRAVPEDPRDPGRPGSGAAPNLEIVAFDDALALGIAGRVAIGIWYGNATAANLDMLIAVGREIRAKHGRFGYLAVVEPGAQPPGFEARSAMLRALRFFRSDLAAYATVPPSNSLVYPIMSALFVLARVRFPIRFLSNVELAADWMVNVLGDASGLSAGAELARAAHELRAQFIGLRATDQQATG